MKKLFFVVLLSSLLPYLPASADELRLTEMLSKGLANHQDKHIRNPTLGVGLVLTSDGTVRAEIAVENQNQEFLEYPIVVEMFVDGELIGKQIKTPTFTKSLGFNLYNQRAFNYQVTATVLHPNRSFTSMVEGTYFPQTSAFNENGELISYNCSLSSSDGANDQSFDNTHLERTGVTSYLVSLGNEELRFNAFDNSIIGEYRSGSSVENGEGQIAFVEDSNSPVSEFEYTDANRTLDCRASNASADQDKNGNSEEAENTALELNLLNNNDDSAEPDNLNELFRGITDTQ